MNVYFYQKFNYYIIMMNGHGAKSIFTTIKL